jgi:tetratricopeptide (TPR) repeat protein
VIDDALDALFLITSVLDEPEPSALLAAETATAAAVLRETAGFCDHPQVRLRLGWLHWLRYQSLPEGEDEAELADSLAFLHSVAATYPDSLPEQVAALAGPQARPDLATAAPIGLVLLRRARVHPDPALLDAALWFFDMARRDAGATADDLVPVLGNIGAAQVTRFERSGDELALDAAVEAAQDAVRIVAEGSEHRSAAYGNLAAALLARAHATGARSDLDGCVEAGTQAIAVAERLGAGDLPTYRTNVASALRVRYEKTADRRDLDRAIDLGRQAVAGVGTHPESAALWLALASSLLLRFEATTDEEDLEAATSAQRAALDGVPDGHPARPIAMANLGNSLRERYLLTGEEPTLREAVELHRTAVRLGADHPQEAGLLTNLASDLSCRYDRSGSPEDLGEALELMERALTLTGADDPRYASRQSNVGSLLWTSALAGGDREQLNRAVELLEAAVAAGGDGAGLDQPALLSNLAAVLMSLFEQTGQPAALHRAARLAREAVAAESEVPPQRRLHLTTLGNVLLTLYEREAETAYLDEAIDMLRRAADSVPAGHPDRASFASNLSNGLRERFERFGDQEAAAEAERLLRRAVADGAGPERATYLSNLASLLHSRFERARTSGESHPELLDQAIELDREAAARLGEGHPDQPRVLSNLSISLRVRYEVSLIRDDLDDAITVARQAVKRVPGDHPDRAVYLGSLGGALTDRHDLSGDDAALAEAAGAYREAAGLAGARPVVRVLAARFWGATALRAGWVDEALTAYEQTFDLLGQVVPRSLSRHDRTHQLGQLSGLASDAAACALAHDDPALAVQWLERGRGVLLAQQLEHRTELDDLRARHPQLADAYETVCLALDAEPGRTGEAGTTSVPPSVVARRRRDLAGRWRQIVADIQAQPGFSGFLRSPSLTELLEETRSGPIAMINVSGHRCDALILTRDGVLHRTLTGLDAETADARVSDFLQAVGAAQDEEATAVEARAAEERISEVLEWAREAIAAPILGEWEVADRPTRLWWSATGAVAFLPLHATVLDDVVSGYTPTVRVLRHLRRNATRRPAEEAPRMMIVAGWADGPALPGVADEVTALCEQVPGAYVLDGPSAAGQILTELPRYAWVHFACHGLSETADPSESRLAVHPDEGRQLTVRDLARLRLADGRLAFLSACDTARTSEAIPDEAIHISAAFQLAGYASVVATLWQVVDRVATTFAAEVYRRLATPGATADIAQVVHEITAEQRTAYRGTPSLWAAYVYSGV